MTNHTEPNDHTASRNDARGWPADIEAIIEGKSRGMSNDDIGLEVGRSSKTVARRLAIPGVSAEVSRRQLERFGATRARLLSDSERAADALGDLLRSEDERVRLQAAVQLLGAASRVHHQLLVEHELVERVETLERRQHNLGEVEMQRQRILGSNEAAR